MPNYRQLDASTESSQARILRTRIQEHVIGQSDAIDALISLYEKFRSGLFDRRRPIGSLLFLGPTGSGKTKVAEEFVSSIFNDVQQCLKIDCGEFQHSHEVAKLIGSPPGYLGHRETPPLINNSRMEALRGDEGFAVIIFDEIEKASDSLWHILLGVLDKGILTTGNNEAVDLTKTMILMTSNAGSGEMSFALGNRIGLAPTGAAHDKNIAEIGVKAAKGKFTTEFINRLDAVVACTALTEEQSRKVINLELGAVQMAIYNNFPDRSILMDVTPAAKEAIFEEGFDQKYNARNVRRVVEKRVQLPLSRIMVTRQCKPEEKVLIDYVDGKFTFAAVEESFEEVLENFCTQQPTYEKRIQ